MVYKKKKYIFSFQQFKTTRSFGDSILICKTTQGEANKKQSNLLENILELIDRAKPRSKLEKLG